MSSQADPPNDAASNHLRAELLMWGGPLAWPSLVQVGLGEGGAAWMEWLMAAGPEDLSRAVQAAGAVGGGPDIAWDKRLWLLTWGHKHGYPMFDVIAAGADTWEEFCERVDDSEIEHAIAQALFEEVRT